MSLLSLFDAFSMHLHSPQFLEAARHREHARAFTRERKLPLPALVAVMLSGMRKSIQAELDEFFAHLDQQAQLARHVSAHAFSRARAKLSATALPALNDWLLHQAGAAGLLPTWQGLRLVAADATKLHFGHCASHVPRAACAEQIAFGLYLPGAEMMFDDAPQAMSTLLPVVLSEAPVVATAATAQTAPSTKSDLIEVIFADAVVRVRQGADAALLRTIFQSLRA